MKKVILLISVLFVINTLQCQIYNDSFKINFDKVIHIVLQNPVDYVNAGSDYVSAETILENKNIVRVICLEEDFDGETNVTIIDKSGKIYAYQVTYGDMKGEASIFYPGWNQNKEDYSVVLNKNNNAVMVFPSPIIYFKVGNEELIKGNLASAKNVITLSTKENEIYESNIFCLDSNGNVYNVIINTGTSSNYVYNFFSGERKELPVAVVQVNTESLKEAIQNALKAPRNIYNSGVNQNKIDFTLNNIFVLKDNYILFLFEIQNNSNILFEVDFIKSFIEDKKTAKNEVNQQTVIESIPIDPQFDLKEIGGKNSVIIPLLFEKFTIPDNKVFKLEIFEKNGGRHIIFKLDNKNLIRAKDI